MGRANPVDTKERRFEQTKKRWDEAERGLGGLRCVRFYDFDELTHARKREMLTEPTILTSDGVEILVIMTAEDYFAKMPPTVKKNPMMLRHEGKMFREVV